ncbi:MAG TPA: hypothetical protein VFV87_01040 [Pirellulaceae bacterium]|nr:hypothetical protein [Pirellulaceae bacterium]
MRCAILVGAFLCGLGLIGCSGSSGTSTTADTDGANSSATPSQGVAAAAAAKPVSVPADAAPDQVVAVFLDALRGGDQATTATLLTAKALAETSKENLSVCPQATPHMQYQIAESQVLPDNPNGAHVKVVWTENYTDGTVSYDVVWVLRRQQEGWRIAGMAIELVPGRGLAFLNFEDPQDMLRKQQEAELEIEKAMAAAYPPAAETAALPAAPPVEKPSTASPPDGEFTPNSAFPSSPAIQQVER